jgi:type 1 glutamine amidotransferase
VRKETIMNPILKKGTIIFIATGLFVSAGFKTWGAPPSEEIVERIKAASPSHPSAVPLKKRKLLVFTLTNGYRHSSIETGAKALEVLGQKSGAWETVVSSDASILERESLAPFDAICFLSTTGDVFTPKNTEKLDGESKQKALDIGRRRNKSLLDFVSSGKGFIGIHAATDTNYNWHEFGEMIGGYFDGHPWGANDSVSIRVEDKDHALTRHFEGQNLDFKEEIYQFKAPYSREKQRVLMGLDLKRTMPKAGMKRGDEDYPVSWIKPYGKGRVFYCSLGHREEMFIDARVLKHYLAGIQFALGDLDAPLEPLPKPPLN